MGLVWVAGVAVLASRWLDVAVLFTTPHPDEAARERAAALWLGGGFTAGAVAMTAVAWLGRVRWLAIATGVLALMGAVGEVAGLLGQA
ncbi:hypothetical protein Afil01_55700 [Actinorhabdospora filicis]|uniref:Uncharacterized protein n=1 Tax=Actinorhabdospora filicis TaxID=1785913 RepID=A0A9W6SR05_9ACTN|nr:hypothetical protein Afil01_55700 [Actinorhabdospora filicis]